MRLRAVGWTRCLSGMEVTSEKLLITDVGLSGMT